MEELKIPSPLTDEQYARLCKGETIEILPAKEGFQIVLNIVDDKIVYTYVPVN